MSWCVEYSYDAQDDLVGLDNSQRIQVWVRRDYKKGWLLEKVVGEEAYIVPLLSYPVTGVILMDTDSQWSNEFDKNGKSMEI
jgi:hypothetical protein